MFLFLHEMVSVITLPCYYYLHNIIIKRPSSFLFLNIFSTKKILISTSPCLMKHHHLREVSTYTKSNLAHLLNEENTNKTDPVLKQY
jgi:hypothetical protein